MAEHPAEPLEEGNVESLEIPTKNPVHKLRNQVGLLQSRLVAAIATTCPAHVDLLPSPASSVSSYRVPRIVQLASKTLCKVAPVHKPWLLSLAAAAIAVLQSVAHSLQPRTRERARVDIGVLISAKVGWHIHYRSNGVLLLGFVRARW